MILNNEINEFYTDFRFRHANSPNMHVLGMWEDTFLRNPTQTRGGCGTALNKSVLFEDLP